MVFRKVTLSLAVLALAMPGVSAFAPINSPAHRAVSTELNMANNNNGKGMAGAVAAGLLLANLMTADPAMAMPSSSNPDFGSTQVVAARSGGRMGGRAAPRMSAPARGAPATSRSYSRTTIVRPMIAPPVISPFGMGYGYGYNPMGGFGLGYGLGAMNSAGDQIRDYRQESEIQSSKAELEQAEKKNLELEQRIRALEQAQQPAAPAAVAQ